jgi:Mitochondrial carrier protein
MTQGTVLVTGGGELCIPASLEPSSRRSIPSLVVAGLGYEIVGRPFDAIRHEWHISSLSVRTVSQPMTAPLKVAAQSRFPPLLDLILKIVRKEGMRGLFRGPSPSVVPPKSSNANGWRSRAYPVLRALARVGPWGIGFLVWGTVGPGIQ